MTAALPGATVLASHDYARHAAKVALEGKIDEAAFLYTQAYILALEKGDDRAPLYRAWLVQHGREQGSLEHLSLRGAL